MVKELSQAREDHLNSFLSAGNTQPHSTAWGAQDLYRDDVDSEDTWSSDSEKESCCSCCRIPHWKRRPSGNQEDDDDEMNTCLVGNDELNREHELQES